MCTKFSFFLLLFSVITLFTISSLALTVRLIIGEFLCHKPSINGVSLNFSDDIYFDRLSDILLIPVGFLHIPEHTYLLVYLYKFLCSYKTWDRFYKRALQLKMREFVCTKKRRTCIYVFVLVIFMLVAIATPVVCIVRNELVNDTDEQCSQTLANVTEGLTHAYHAILFLTNGMIVMVRYLMVFFTIMIGVMWRRVAPFSTVSTSNQSWEHRTRLTNSMPSFTSRQSRNQCSPRSFAPELASCCDQNIEHRTRFRTQSMNINTTMQSRNHRYRTRSTRNWSRGRSSAQIELTPLNQNMQSMATDEESAVIESTLTHNSEHDAPHNSNATDVESESVPQSNQNMDPELWASSMAAMNEHSTIQAMTTVSASNQDRDDTVSETVANQNRFPDKRRSTVTGAILGQNRPHPSTVGLSDNNHMTINVCNISNYFQEVCDRHTQYLKEYEAIHKLVIPIYKIFRSFFILQWIIHLFGLFFHIAYLLRPWIRYGQVTDFGETVVLQQIYQLLNILFEGLALVITHICALKMNAYLRRYIREIQKKQQEKTRDDDLQYSLTHLFLIKNESVSKANFTPRIPGTGLSISVSSPGFVVSIVLSVFALIGALVTF